MNVHNSPTIPCTLIFLNYVFPINHIENSVMKMRWIQVIVRVCVRAHACTCVFNSALQKGTLDWRRSLQAGGEECNFLPASASSAEITEQRKPSSPGRRHTCLQQAGNSASRGLRTNNHAHAHREAFQKHTLEIYEVNHKLVTRRKHGKANDDVLLLIQGETLEAIKSAHMEKSFKHLIIT